MAFTYGFYNYDKNDLGTEAKLYNAEQISNLFDGLITDGIYEHVGNRFVMAGHDEGYSKIYIGTGRAWINHTWCYNDSPFEISPSAGPTTGDRVDAIVIDVNNDTRHNDILWIDGDVTSGGLKPSSPDLINTKTHVQKALYYIYRRANETSIRTEDITEVIGTVETPYVSGVLKNDIIYTHVLSAGNTEVVFDDVYAPENSIISVGCSKPGVEYNDISLHDDNWYNVTFDAQEEDIIVYLIVSGVS